MGAITTRIWTVFGDQCFRYFLTEIGLPQIDLNFRARTYYIGSGPKKRCLPQMSSYRCNIRSTGVGSWDIGRRSARIETRHQCMRPMSHFPRATDKLMPTGISSDSAPSPSRCTRVHHRGGGGLETPLWLLRLLHPLPLMRFIGHWRSWGTRWFWIWGVWRRWQGRHGSTPWFWNGREMGGTARLSLRRNRFVLGMDTSTKASLQWS